MHIYTDESEGDILVIAAVVTNRPKELKNVLKRTKQSKLPERLRAHSEIKATHATDNFKRYFYKHLALLKEPRIYSIHIDKKKIPAQLQGQEGMLYLSMFIGLLEQAIPKDSSEVFVYCDRRPLKGISSSGLVTTISQRFGFSLNRPRRFEVIPTDSTADAGVQVADFVSHALFQKYEHGNTEGYDMIKKLVIKEIDALKVL